MRRRFEIFRGLPKVLLVVIITVTQERLASSTPPQDLIKIRWQIGRPITCLCLSPIAVVTIWSMFSKMAHISRDFILYSRSDSLHSF